MRPPLWVWATTLLLLSGCGRPANVVKGEADMRIKLFQQCMELAAKNGRHSDDNVSDIVKACDNASAYQAMQWGASQ